MLYDLNVVWPADAPPGTAPPAVVQTLAVLSDFGYTCVALNCRHSGKITPSFQCPIDAAVLAKLRTQLPKLTILTRITIILDDSSIHQNLAQVYPKFDLVALRPLSEKAMLSACSNLDPDLISIDYTRRLPFYLRHKTVGAAIERGIKFEICYAPAIHSADSRRFVITNATGLIRVSRNRGLIISSEADAPTSCRGPYDVANLATLWGLDHMRARDAVGRTAQLVVTRAHLRNNSYKQVIEIPNTEPLEPKKPKEPTEPTRPGKRPALQTAPPSKKTKV